MKHPLLLVAGVILAALFLSGPRAGAAPLHEGEILSLPDGRQVKVLSMSRVEYSTGVMALMLRYQTSLSVDQHKALSNEVNEVWHLAQKEVERLGFHAAILSSNEVPHGIFFTASRVLNFVFEEGPDGQWTRISGADFMASSP